MTGTKNTTGQTNGIQTDGKWTDASSRGPGKRRCSYAKDGAGGLKGTHKLRSAPVCDDELAEAGHVLAEEGQWVLLIEAQRLGSLLCLAELLYALRVPPAKFSNCDCIQKVTESMMPFCNKQSSA